MDRAGQHRDIDIVCNVRGALRGVDCDPPHLKICRDGRDAPVRTGDGKSPGFKDPRQAAHGYAAYADKINVVGCCEIYLHLEPPFLPLFYFQKGVFARCAALRSVSFNRVV